MKNITYGSYNPQIKYEKKILIMGLPGAGKPRTKIPKSFFFM